MRKKIIEISNHLVMAENHIPGIGLANGKMGIAMNMYHASKALGYKAYQDFADNLIESILDDLKTCQDLLFFNGITGIGMGLNSLIRDKFIAPDSNDLFIDMDRKMFMEARQRNINDFAEDFSVFSFGLYLLNRTANVDLNLKLGIPIHEAVNTALGICEEMYARYFSFDSKSIIYTNSVLYFLINQCKNKDYKQRSNSLIELVVAKIIIALNNDPILINRLGTTLALVKAVNKTNVISNKLLHIANKLSKKQVLTHAKDEVDINLTKAWESMLYHKLYEYRLDPEYVGKWLDNADFFADNAKLVNVDFRHLVICGLYNITDNQSHKLLLS